MSLSSSSCLTDDSKMLKSFEPTKDNGIKIVDQTENQAKEIMALLDN